MGDAKHSREERAAPAALRNGLRSSCSQIIKPRLQPLGDVPYVTRGSQNQDLKRAELAAIWGAAISAPLLSQHLRLLPAGLSQHPLD